MSARIIELADVRAKRAGRRSRQAKVTPQPVAHCENFYFWRGASGSRYVHSIYSLIECPELPNTNYLLVKRDETTSQRLVLGVGLATHHAPSLNLAEIRQRGALLGANEVHVHMLAGSLKQAKLIEFDLRASLYGLDAATMVHH